MRTFGKHFNGDLVAQPLYLCVFAKHFGVEADPVVRDKHATLVEDVFLQSAGVTWQTEVLVCGRSMQCWIKDLPYRVFAWQGNSFNLNLNLPSAADYFFNYYLIPHAVFKVEWIVVIIKDLLCLSCSSLLISLNILWYWQLLFESWNNTHTHKTQPQTWQMLIDLV